ncbi:type III secretion system cytoplasmic ring protein SctQ [Xanthomonas sp. WHRI 1810A]|uniref:type III secretion system cytoplasmic ring protein SctQ n=1 Tax=Xanthomonas sp. WHRI 1810A TaxID=3161565 RepID=UPI0032E87A97
MTCREAAMGADAGMEWLSVHDPRWMALHNRLHRHRYPWQGQVAGQAVTVRWSSVAAPVGPVFDLRLTLGSVSLVMQLPHEALEGLGLVSQNLNGLSGSLLLELALLGLIEPLEQLTGQDIRVVDAAAAAESIPPSTLSLTLDVQIAQASTWPVTLQMSAESAQLIADLLDRHAAPARHPLFGLRLPLKVENGEAPLSVAELHSLRPGDVLMLDDGPPAQVRLVLAGRLQARAELKGDTARLLEPPTPVPLMKDAPMTETADANTLDSTLDALPLTLVCQVGSVELSLAQLRELGAGSLVQLAPQLHDSVDLMVNGRRVGQGQLVKIGDGLGVRLLSFASA